MGKEQGRVETERKEEVGEVVRWIGGGGGKEVGGGVGERRITGREKNKEVGEEAEGWEAKEREREEGEWRG